MFKNTKLRIPGPRNAESIAVRKDKCMVKSEFKTP